MKATIEDLKDTFKIGYEAFEDSRKEADTVWNLYHNRQFTPEQLAILERRGQPAETFNVIKMFARMLVGYYSTVVNDIVVRPTNPRDIYTATVLNDVINYILKSNRFDIEGDKLKLGGLVSGLLCSYTNISDSGKTDQFSRTIFNTTVNYVPDAEIILDPSSRLDDYSDATYMHRFRWLTEDAVRTTFGQANLDKLDEYNNFLNIDEAEFEFFNYNHFTGYYRVHNNYLIVHSVIEDQNGKRWSVFWSGDVILLKEEITTKEARWPYRVQKLHSSDKTEYYGIFREIIESQNAINQAVIKIQLMANSEKVYAEVDAVENMDDFTDAVNRVSSVIPVLRLSGIKVEEMSREIGDQYAIIDRALDRIQRVLGVNDSFMGMAFASDSGRKVKLQQNQSIMSLRYITVRIEAFYRSLGQDIANLVKQYYRASQVLSIADEVEGQRWLELNRPMMKPVMGPGGVPQEVPVLLPETDPANGDIITDEDGNILLAPVSEEGTDISFTEFEIDISSSAFNDEDERAQLMLETVMSGQIGSMLSQVNPAGFFKVSALAMKSMKTKYTPDIVEVLNQTAAMLGGNPQAQAEASAMAQGNGGGASNAQMSRQLKLPQNTNEGSV